MADSVTAKRQDLWNAMHEFIRNHGGVVTSVSGTKVVRVEMPKESALPSKLRDLGYDPRQCGRTTRITPAGRFTTTDIIEIILPGK